MMPRAVRRRLNPLWGLACFGWWTMACGADASSRPDAADVWSAECHDGQDTTRNSDQPHPISDMRGEFDQTAAADGALPDRNTTGDDGPPDKDTAAADRTAGSDLADAEPTDLAAADMVPGGPDGPDADITADAQTADDGHGADVAMRHWVSRGIGGASMGGSSIFIALDHPGEFDVVTPLGGYYDLTYMLHHLERAIGGGFCSREQLLAHLGQINEADNPEVFCGPVAPEDPLELLVDFNHFHYTSNGGELDRTFHFDVFDGYMLAIGNFVSYNPASSFLPAGMDPLWFSAAQDVGCGAPFSVGLPNNLNVEYNPDGAYPLITFCDGEEPVGCYQDDPALCDENNPDFYTLMGAYDPTYPNHDRPVNTALAVDYNGNGLRDYGEPVVYNSHERFEDTGSDGCFSLREDGLGGCLSSDAPAQTGDPNGDDYDKYSRPAGQEGNWTYDPGEPYVDLGLDGVAAPPPYQPDYGEGNGTFDMSPNMALAMSIDAHRRIAQLPAEQLADIDFYFDAGIRDFMNAAVATSSLVGALRDRGQQVRQYEDYVATDQSLLPGASYTEYVSFLMDLDFSPARWGRNIYVRYGDPDADLEAIRKGDGDHVGSPGQDVARFLTAFLFATRRFPDPTPGTPAHSVRPTNNQWSSYYSEGLQSRRRFALILPPGYFDEDQSEQRFPVFYFLHGHGMTPIYLQAMSLITVPYTKSHGMPRLIMAFPDGRCCYRHTPTGRHECACDNADGGMMACLDPQCRGPHETCEERLIPRDELEQECFGGSFFLNLQADRWGDPAAAAYMRYEDSVMDLVHHIDATYRTRLPADYPR